MVSFEFVLTSMAQIVCSRFLVLFKHLLFPQCLEMATRGLTRQNSITEYKHLKQQNSLRSSKNRKNTQKGSNRNNNNINNINNNNNNSNSNNDENSDNNKNKTNEINDENNSNNHSNSNSSRIIVSNRDKKRSLFVCFRKAGRKDSIKNDNDEAMAEVKFHDKVNEFKFIGSDEMELNHDVCDDGHGDDCTCNTQAVGRRGSLSTQRHKNMKRQVIKQSKKSTTYEC